MKRILTTLALLATGLLAAAQTTEIEKILASFRSADPAENYKGVRLMTALSGSAGALTPDADPDGYLRLDADGLWRMRYADTTRVLLTDAFRGRFVPSGYRISPDGNRILLEERLKPIYRHSYTARYYLAEGPRLRRILAEVPDMRDASFSPDGRGIAFSSGNDLWFYDLATDSLRRVSDDGRWNERINGTTDWVYEEEFGFTRAYAFSPDGRKLAYLSFDESRVPLFEMMRFDSTLYNKAYAFKYPKAGEPNSTVGIRVYDLATGGTRKVDAGPDEVQYVPRLEWTPAGDLLFYRINRRQNHFEAVVDRDGIQRVIYSERSPLYVERPIGAMLTFLDGDRFIVREETTTGWWHLYLHSIRKGRLHAITQGAWEVTALAATDGKTVWYTSTEASPLRRDLYRISIDGGRKQRLTGGDGFYTVQPGKGMRYYVENFSSASSPGRVSVRRGSDGSFVRMLAAPAVDLAAAAAEGDALLRKEFISFVTERGDTLNAWIVRPEGFDSAKKYPVLLTQYSGPGSQEVADRWKPDWTDALPYKGYVVASLDGRGTGFRGERFKKQTYGDLGSREAEDQISFARYLAAQPWADAERIGIYGWSYGGFMALSCALRGEGLFRMAIAVAPVTSWRYYDSVYTETYNGLPEEHAAGYDENSPLHMPQKLSPRTRLLLVHGSADDNVHFQNTMEMARRLNREGALYDMMVYPDQNHSMMPTAMEHVRIKMIDYTLRNL